MSKFKVGDKVRRNVTSTLGTLKEGVVYTVQKIEFYDIQKIEFYVEWIVLEESNKGGWDPNKFTLVQPRVDKEFEDLWV